MKPSQSVFWADHYARPDVRNRPWLDLSNESVQAQTFSLAAEAAGPVRNRACLDVGCGAGRFVAILDGLGARHVTAVDQVLDPRLDDRFHSPRIRWLRADLQDSRTLRALPVFDLVFALEVLQYVPFAAGLLSLWEHVVPGGRLIVVVPNGACPIVGRAAARFLQGTYAAPGPDEVRTGLDGLPGIAARAVRSLEFQPDQRFVPYHAGPWGPEPAGGPPPNRWLFAALKAAA